MMKRRSGFTLVELITVMAISVVLLSIIIVPMIQTFNATRIAQSFSDAQDKARLLTERISREVGEAVAVRDIEGRGGQCSIVIPIPDRGADEAGVTVTTPGGWTKTTMNYTKVDIVLPEKVGQRGPGGGFIDPNTGKEDPTLKNPKGQVKLPLAPGTTVKRYWIGLRDPFTNYTNPYDGLLSQRSGGRDNLFVLYSAEVEPVRMVETPVGSGNFVPQVNTELFDLDAVDPSGRTPLFDDPDFFLATGADVGAPVNNDAKAQRIRNWQKRSTIVTEISRYDMIQPIYDRRTRLVLLNNTGVGWAPRITPLIQFRPSHVEGDGSDSQVTAPLGDETEGGAAIGPEVYQSQFGMWSTVRVRTFDSNWVPGNPYQIARKDADDLNIYAVEPVASGLEDTSIGSGQQLFNITSFEQAKKGQLVTPAYRYPFSFAVNAPAVTGNATLNSLFMPFYTNATTGKVIASFAIGDVGNSGANPNAPANLFAANDFNPVNLPQVPAQNDSSGWTANDASLTPSTDPTVATGVFSDAPYWNTAFNRFNINRVFNKVWADAQANRNGIPTQFGEIGGAHRFIDLRTIPQGDGTASPLAQYNRAAIVPGSEEVFGPDQNPGPNYSHQVRYRRVNKEPGPNEYRINYANLNEPSAAGWAALGLPVPPATYTRTNFVSAVVQPRYRAGYIQLCSNPEVPVPAVMSVVSQNPVDAPGTTYVVPGRIRVAYRFQFTTSQDVMRVEYDTRQLMQVLVTIRNYPQAQNLPNPQTVTMKATANVRNFIR
jgi:prepilin-type N-terminal cleavage/methylation domain-containing protein